MPKAVLTREFRDWVASLRDRRARARIVQRISRYEVMGALGDVKPVGGRISEMRIHYGPGYRLYFTMRGQEMIILLCGSDKNDQARMIGRATAIAAEVNVGEESDNVEEG
jgi:putative addiction module killer protein